jgi:hypothetical protein
MQSVPQPPHHAHWHIYGIWAQDFVRTTDVPWFGIDYLRPIQHVYLPVEVRLAPEALVPCLPFGLTLQLVQKT